MTYNSLSKNEEQDIPSQRTFEDHFWIACLSYSRPQYVWFLTNLQGSMIPNSSGQLAELIVYIIHQSRSV